MLTITIDTAKGSHEFNWDATAEEFQRLCDWMEQLAAEEGHDPRDIVREQAKDRRHSEVIEAIDRSGRFPS
jgi:hypothetical protein